MKPEIAHAIHTNDVLHPPERSGYRAGRVLAGRYQLISLLGIGAMGEVYRARDLVSQQLCAIKLVFSGAVRCLNAERRFQKEAAVVARLFHPNIVEVREFCVDADGTHFLVMELLHGQDLYSLLSKEGALPHSQAIEILRGVGAALQYAHDLGIVHRDIKPNNIFLCQRGDGKGGLLQQIKVLDFGLAKIDELDGFLAESTLVADTKSPSGPPLTQGLVIGTPAYLAPEATIAGGQLVDPRSDQWSLAVVAYELLTGQLPFQESNPYQLCLQIRHKPHTPVRTLVAGIPEHVAAAIDTALSKDRERRFGKIQDFVRALDNLPQLIPSRSTSVSAEHTLHKSLSLYVPLHIETEVSQMPAHKPAHSHREPPENLRTVQYSAAELLALTQKSAHDPEAVPQPIEDGIPTRRCELIPERQRTQGVPSLAELTAEAQQRWAPVHRPEQLPARVMEVTPPSLSASELHHGLLDQPRLSYPHMVPVPRFESLSDVPTRSSAMVPPESTLRRERSAWNSPWRQLQGAGALLLCGLILLSAFLLGIYHARVHTGSASHQTADSSLATQAHTPTGHP